MTVHARTHTTKQAIITTGFSLPVRFRLRRPRTRAPGDLFDAMRINQSERATYVLTNTGIVGHGACTHSFVQNLRDSTSDTKV